MKSVVCKFSFFILVFFIVFQTQAYVTVSGDVSGQYWHNTDTYYVDGNITINDGSSLEIEAGTRVKIAPNVYFTVYGTLIANGTDISNIIFTSRDDDSVGEIILESDGDPNPGDWHGIYLNGSNADGIGEFNYCRLRYGGYTFGAADANVRFNQSASGHFNNSTSEYSSTDGLKANFCAVDISGSSFNNNTGYAATLDNVTIKNYPNNSASGNGFNVFGVNGDVIENLIWTESSLSVILSLTGQVEILDNIVCTIPEGTIIKSENNGTMYVRGSLDVNGTVSNPVVFTSIKDDTYGGDSNNDAATTIPAPGDWHGIYLYGTGDNDGIGEFDYCRVRYGGYFTGSADANIFFNTSNSGHFLNSFSEYSYYDGIKSSFTSIDISGSSFINNNGYAALLNGVPGIKNYPNNSASGNGIDAFGINGQVTENLIWTNTTSSVLLSLTGQVTVNDDIVCTIPEGTIIKSNNSGNFNVSGTLDVNGTASNPVIITSLQDDAYGGDINNDAANTLPAPGDWHGIYLVGTGDNEGIGEFDYCRIRYGGFYNGSPDANIFFNTSNSGHFLNSFSEYSYYDGIKSSFTSIDISGSSFINNNGYAALLNGVPGIKNYPNNSASGNGIDAFGINGQVTENLIWTNTASSVILSLTGQVNVNDDVVCTIPEGTIIKSNNSGNFNVSGTLDVNGTAPNPVIITSLQDDVYGGDINNDGTATLPAPGDWHGIYLVGTGDNDGIGEFDYCRVRFGGHYGGSSDANIFFNTSNSGHFLNSYSEYSYYDGIKSSFTSIDISGSSFINNNSYAALLNGVPGIKNYPNNSASGNGIDAFGIHGTITENLLWTETSSSVILSLTGQIKVNDDVVCTIPEGTIIKSNIQGNFYVSGTLDVNGTLSNPVVITSLKDDTYGGDINGDLSATLPAPGDWHGIYLSGNGEEDGIGEFDYCRLRYGGYSNGTADANIFFNYSDAGHFNNSYCEYSSQYGIKSSVTTIDISGSSFENNSGIAAYLEYTSVQNYPNNSANGNGGDIIGLNGTIDENITWTSTSSSMMTGFIGTVTVADNIEVSIPEGTIFKSINSGKLIVNGTINANGTTLNPIIFTSLEDDSYGGDSNNDGTTSSPAPADWYGITITGTNDNDGVGWFDHCRVRYAGYYSNASSSVYFNEPGDGYFKNSIIEFSQYGGLNTLKASFDASNNQFLNNGTIGLNSVSSNLVLDNSIFNDNGGNGINSSHDTLQINNCQFNDNGGYTARLENVRDIKTYAGNTGSGNTINAFGISGKIYQNLTLSESVCGFPYVIIGNLTLADDYTLTIPAGEIIKVDDHSSTLFINGTINAIGTLAQPIVFTSLTDDTYGGDLNADADATTPSPGDWAGLQISGEDDNDGIGWFDFCKIRYAGWYTNNNSAIYFNRPDDGYFKNSIVEFSANNGLNTLRASFDASNNLFLNNGEIGLSSNTSNLVLDYSIFNDNGTNGLNSYYDTLQINNCQFNNNGNYAAWLEKVKDVKSYTGNTGSGNTINAFAISGDIYQNFSMSETVCGFPYVINGKLTVTDNYTLDIPAGEIIKALDLQSQIFVYGTVNAIGTQSQPIVFTSLKDDSFGGDLNGDADATIPTPGDWAGIYILGTDDNDGIGFFEFSKINFAGSYINNYTSVYLYNSDTAGFINNSIDSSLSIGLKTYNTEFLVRNNTFKGNTSYGLHIMNGTKVPDLGQNNLANAGLNTFIDNDGGNFQLYYESSQEINAFYNDWGYYTEAEIDAHIYDDNENAAKGEVLFNPWYDPANPPLVPEFIADVTSGYDPLTVNFTDQTLFTPTSWEWDFDNDGTVDATDQNPEWTYQYPGIYSVKLEVGNGITTDVMVKPDYITVTEPTPITIAEARLEPQGSIVCITGYVTSGNEFGNLHFIQDETAGAGIYDPGITNLRMGDSLLIMGETTVYNGLFELVNNTYSKIISRNNPMPDPQIVSITDLSEDYEAEVVRINLVDFPYGGNSFFGGVDYDIIDPTATTHFRLQNNSDLNYQRAPENTVSITGICSHRTDDNGFEYGIYARDYADLIYTDIQDFETEAIGFSKRYSFTNAVDVVDENIVWVLAKDGKNDFILNEFSKTVNGGLSWESGSLPNNDGLYNGGIAALDASTAWVVANKVWGTNPQGIFKTEDGGTTWAHQSTAVFDANIGGFPNTVYFWDANTGVCLGDPTSGYFEIYTTTNGGDNWTRVLQTNIPDPILDEYGISNIYSVVGNTIWFSTTKGRVYKSIDQGYNWTVVQTPLSDYCNVEFKDEMNGLLISQVGWELYETSDGGTSWNQIFYTGDLQSNDLKHIPGTPGSYVVTGNNGSDAGASYTIDNGQNWFYFPETHGVHMDATDWVGPTSGFIGANNIDATEGGMWKYTGEAIGLYSVSWLPENPLDNETITITVGDVTEGAWLHWGVNNWQTPDMAYWPSGTEPFPGGGQAVQSTMIGPDENHELTIVLGPFNDPAQAISSVDFVIHYFDETWDNNNGDDYQISVSPGAMATVDLKVYLEGPINGTVMNTSLTTVLPLAQPYNTYPWEYNGDESVASMPANVVDWVLVEYRDAVDANSANSSTSMGGQAAFVLDDGKIVDLNGIDPLTFAYSLSENLFVVIWHRNHLPVMSGASLVLTDEIYSFDFTTSASQAYGDNQNNLGGIFGMIGGDANGDGTINETDGIEQWYPVVGKTGYYGGDVNMDKQVNNKDKNDIWLPNYGKSEQLPPDGFTSCGDILVDDRDGQFYNTVQIGTQCWMAENLNVGTPIDGDMDQNNNSIIEKYCYNDVLANCDMEGGLYQWEELMNYNTGEGAQGICPDNWHVPSKSEWETLNAFVGLDGNALKATSEGTGVGVGTNLSGFSAFLSGILGNDVFSGYDLEARFWNSTHQTTNYAYRFNLSSEHGEISGGVTHISFGYSVRCLKD